VVFAQNVMAEDPGTVRMQELSEIIHIGAKAFLHKEYTILAAFVGVMFCVLCGVLYENDDKKCEYQAWLDVNAGEACPDAYVYNAKFTGVYTGIAFLVGAFLSALAGYGGMFIATKANVRTTQACTKSMNDGLRVAFKSGAVMGLTVVSFGLIGLSVLYLIFTIDSPTKITWQYLSGFGFGASSIALFARVGGGVYTKAADVGADLVGKVEAGIPEDDVHNPAVIADNVGDNVGDVAGMGADLFESYVGSIIAAATIGYDTYSKVGNDNQAFCCVFNLDLTGSSSSITGGNFDTSAAIFETQTNYAIGAIALPFWIAGMGLVCSIIGTFLVRTNADETQEPNVVLESLLGSIRTGIYGASALVVCTNAVACYICLGGSGEEWKVYGCTVCGLLAGNVIGFFTEYSTSYSYSPTTGIAEKSNTGPATVIIQGLGVGMISTVVPLITLVVTIIACNALASRFGIAMAAVSMLATLGITLATDAYGPVADNAGGIAEMVGDDVNEDTRVKTDALDALGNTTAASGKGFAIGSAALTSVALISAFIEQVGLLTVSVEDPVVLGGMLLGSTLPFLFAALTMLSVGKAAEAMIIEVRRQFAEYPELKTATATGWKCPPGVPEYEKCVAISTQAAIVEMFVPGIVAIFAPPACGYLLGSKALVGMLVGALVTGILLAITMANAGGAWDNAKKYVEKGGLGEGKGKGTMYHDAVVVGDTVGDPFKDTSGPALNILIKMMSLISLVLAPSFRNTNATGNAFGDGWFVGLIVIILVGIVILVYLKLTEETTIDLGAVGKDKAPSAAATVDEPKAEDASKSEETSGVEMTDKSESVTAV